MEREKMRQRAVSETAKARLILRLLNVWLAHPQLRLSQVILNVCMADAHRYYAMEDEPFIAEIERFYAEVHPLDPGNPVQPPSRGVAARAQLARRMAGVSTLRRASSRGRASGVR